MYFVHSYHAVAALDDDVAAESDYPDPFAAVVWRDNLTACQFHPEKSQATGLGHVCELCRDLSRSLIRVWVMRSSVSPSRSRLLALGMSFVDRRGTLLNAARRTIQAYQAALKRHVRGRRFVRS